MAGDASQSSRRSSSVAGATAADSGVTDEELRSCLLSEVEDTLRLKLEEEESKTKAELESLSLVNHELLDNQVGSHSSIKFARIKGVRRGWGGF